MYNFIDTTETWEGTSLPSEALKINGEYIENLIAGYRTLTVEGREALSPEITTVETGARDGSSLKGKRYPARTIRITYQLIAATSEDFRAAYNQLAQILDVEDAELIFNDETDKFFVGTPSRIGEVPPGKNAVVGEFEILCLDPFKYSVMEYVALPSEGESSIMVNYNGTYKSYPKLEAEFYNEDDASADGETVTGLTGNGDCGYVAFFNEDEKIIQIGDPDEVDGEDVPKSQTLINQSFKESNSWGTAAKSLWAVNSGITSSNAVEQAGSFTMGVGSYRTPAVATSKTTTLLSTTSKTENPYIHYKVTARSYNRTASTATVTVNIDTWLDNSSSYFGNGLALSCTVSIGSIQRTVVLKKEDENWQGKTVHTKSFTVTFDVSANITEYQNIKFKAFRTDSTGGQSGVISETACNNIALSEYARPEPNTYYLTPINYGTGSNWHGPSITRTIPADAAGDTGATNFTLSYMQKMCIGSGKNGTNQLGAFQVLLVSGSGTSRKIVAGVNVYKGGGGKMANLRFYLDNAVKETMQIDLSASKSPFDMTKASSITKDGAKVSFNIGGITKSFASSQISETPVNEITFTFTKFGTSPALAYNGLSWVKFVKNNCDMFKDVPNKFSTNDVVEADCNTGEIYLNGVSKPSLGALGNDWEDFCLTPGINQIGFSYSEWVDEAYAPAFKVKYREVFL